MARSGARCLHVRNAAGLDFTILADRVMGLYDAQFQGVPLAFISSVGATHPAYAEQPGFGWLHTWHGGFLTPCGRTQVGSPVNDNGEELGLHGRLSNLAAQHLKWGADWQDDRYVLWAEGSLRETSVFGVNLIMKRRISTTLDEAKMWLEDRIENHGLEPAPLMVLQHFNLGFPLVDSATRLVWPAHTTVPRDEAARSGLDHCLEFDDPIDGYQEQVFYHDLQADSAGPVEVRLVNPAFNHGQGLGVTWRYPRVILIHASLGQASRQRHSDPSGGIQVPPSRSRRPSCRARMPQDGASLSTACKSRQNPS